MALAHGASMDGTLDSGGVRLVSHLARPPGHARVPGLVLCHGFPSGPRGAAASATSFPELAERLAAEAGWAVLAFNCRGTGNSDGDFSVDGWLADQRAAVEHLAARDDVTGVWICGSNYGGTLAVCTAAADERIRGVATLSAPATLREWTRDPMRFREHCRAVGVFRSPDFPTDAAAWAHALVEVEPLAAAAELPPRPYLVMHGSDDDVVPVTEARRLAEAARDSSELRVVPKGGHRLRHDPRAVATLIGWLDRQYL